MSLTLPALPYALDALEPFVSRWTLALHHGRHHAAYVEKTVQLTRGTALEATPLEEIVRASARDSDRALFHASAQAWNHAFYWRSMRKGGGGEPRGHAARLLADSFPNYQAFCQEFIRKASDRFASGWAWLVLDRSQLRIVTTGNADTPLTSARRPLLACDLWEHAYYPDYQNRRVDYVAAFLANLVDWDFVNQNLAVGPALPAFAGAGI
jgi:Fe-Mn family superoxide dismutase